MGEKKKKGIKRGIVEGAVGFWKLLKGKKRRISSYALFGAIVIPEPTIKTICAVVGVLFGGADAIPAAIDTIKKKNGK